MKIKEYSAVCLYLKESDLVQFIQLRTAGNDDLIKWQYHTKYKELVLRYPDFQERWTFINPKTEEDYVMSRLCGREIAYLRFLDGDYNSHDIMYALSRMRGGVNEAEAL